MVSLRDFIESARREVPTASLAGWASIFFTLSVLSFLISLAVAQAFLGSAGIFYALHVLRDRPSLSFPPLKLPLALFCLTTIISIAWAESSAVGWFAVRKLVLLLILLLSLDLVLSSKHLTILYHGLFIESAVAGLVAVGQFVLQYRAVRAAHPDRIYYYLAGDRISGFMGHWMNFGGQQMLVFAALAAFLLQPSVGEGCALPRTKKPPVREGSALPRDPGGLRYEEAPGKGELCARASSQRAPLRRGKMWWLVLAIIATSIVLNFTRGVWLGCFIATLYLLGCRRPRWLWALPVLLVVGYLAAPSLIRHRLEILRHPSTDPALAIRLEMWDVGLRMIEQHPWVGVGPNNIPEVYTLYLAPGEAPIAGYRDHLHNDFLQFAAERGLPCLAAWVWFMAALGWSFWRIRREFVRWRRQTWVIDAAMAGWLAFLAEGCFEFNFGTSPVLMVFLFIVCTPFVAEKQTTVDSYTQRHK